MVLPYLYRNKTCSLKIRNYLSLIKFSHTIFAMPFALIGFFLGIVRSSNIERRSLNKTMEWGWDVTSFAWWKNNFFTKLLLVILCMVFARSAAMAFNRYLDRNFDARNPRT